MSLSEHQVDPEELARRDSYEHSAADNYGNLTLSRVSDYPYGGEPARTYNFNYLAWAPYTTFYIFNRMTSATVTPSGGSPVTLSTTYYDASCGGFGTIPTSAGNNYDATNGTRGNPSVVSGMNGADTTCTAVDSAGVPYYSADANGHSISIQTGSDSNYSLPSTISPNGNSAMGTSASYASSWAVASMTGPNGTAGSTTYDTYGRPTQTQSPDGASTTYTYTYAAGASTQTAKRSTAGG